MTPLEALKKIKQYNDLGNPVRGQTNLIDIIENALKEYEKLKHWSEVCEDKIDTLETSNRRKDEVLRIIKSNSKIKTAILSNVKNWNDYHTLKEILNDN